MKYFLFGLLSMIAFCTACEEGDDDYHAPLVYEVCDASLTFSENDRSNIEAYTTDEISSNIRSYVAAEFPGYAIHTVTSFETSDGSQFIEVLVSNNGQLLFDGEGIFVCGQDGLSAGGYGDDEHIKPEDLPQTILDYITQNHPGTTIKEAELEDGEYEVKLSNGVKLCFDSQGNFIGDNC